MALRTVKRARWHRKRQDKNKCCAREGHATTAWGRDALLLFGGFGQTPDKEYHTYNDVYILKVHGSDCTWTRPVVAGTPPSGRYGHTLARCGREWDMAVAIGGMTESGYFGETNTVAVLAPPARAATIPTNASPTATAAAAGGEGEGGAAAARKGPGKEQKAPELCWVLPDVSGSDLVPGRGYHSASVSEDGSKVYVFGGISQRQNRSDVAMLDLDTWSWSVLETQGTPPAPRFGHSSVVHGGRLWVFGGGWGYDLLRSGGDHDDVAYLDLNSLLWQHPPELEDHLYGDHIGRCHSAALVGSKILFFGGSLDMSNELCWLDLDKLEWGQPLLMGDKPLGRLSASLDLVGDRLLMFGGWMPGSHNLGDLYALNLVTFGEAAWADVVEGLMDDIDEFSECTLPTCPCQKMLRKRRSPSSAPMSVSARDGLYRSSGIASRAGPRLSRSVLAAAPGPSASGRGLWSHDESARRQPPQSQVRGLWRSTSGTMANASDAARWADTPQSMDAALGRFLCSIGADPSSASLPVAAAVPSLGRPRLWSTRSTNTATITSGAGGGAARVSPFAASELEDEVEASWTSATGAGRSSGESGASSATAASRGSRAGGSGGMLSGMHSMPNVSWMPNWLASAPGGGAEGMEQVGGGEGQGCGLEPAPQPRAGLLWRTKTNTMVPP